MTPATHSEQSAHLFQLHRKALQDLYAQLPDEQGSFSAWEGGLTFIGLADHLAASSGRLPATVRGETPDPDAAASTTLSEARSRLQTSTEQTCAVISGLDDEALAREVTAFGEMQLSVGALLDIVLAHEAHHKGQVWTMARLVGVHPPRYLKFG